MKIESTSVVSRGALGLESISSLVNFGAALRRNYPKSISIIGPLACLVPALMHSTVHLYRKNNLRVNNFLPRWNFCLMHPCRLPWDENFWGRLSLLANNYDAFELWTILLNYFKLFCIKEGTKYVLKDTIFFPTLIFSSNYILRAGTYLNIQLCSIQTLRQYITT